MRILITGSNGLLGSKLVRQLKESNIDFLATSKGENRNTNLGNQFYKPLDITDFHSVENTIKSYKPTVIIHTAAMTEVDLCEDEKDLCDKINVQGTKNLYDVCLKEDIHLILLSTDFVFDGKNGPYRENDEVNPLSYYAKSKKKAEDILLYGQLKKYTIIRTIIVFGYEPHLSRSNFILWGRSALKEGNSLKIVNDQFRAPTDANDLAFACIQAAEKKAYGIFHVSGPETKSIYEWMIDMAEFYHADKQLIVPVSTATLNQKAQRPPKTGFIIEKARKILEYNPSSFEESLKKLDKELE